MTEESSSSSSSKRPQLDEHAPEGSAAAPAASSASTSAPESSTEAGASKADAAVPADAISVIASTSSGSTAGPGGEGAAGFDFVFQAGDDTWSIADEERSNAGDSALGEDLADSTISLRSSLFEGVSENGRMYHKYKEGKYVLPSDDRELDRLDLQHQLFLMTTDYKLSLAPMENDPQQVLDVGTGTGIWAIDFAQEHPNSNVIGVDLAPSQPDFVPDNCRFEIDDVEEPWTWNEKFDYIHARQMTSSFADWPKFFRQCYDNMKPGAWLEMQDTNFPLQSQDDTYHPGTALWQWSDKIVKGLDIFQRELATKNFKRYMWEAGFVDVKEVQFVWPQNPWPKDPKLKELGRWHLVNSLDGLEGYSMRLFTMAHGMSTEEIQVFLAQVRNDMKNPKIHAYWPMYYVYGRKPVNAPA